MEGWGELEVNEELWDVWKEGSSRKYEITELIDVPHSEKHLLLKRELEEGVGTDKGKTGSVPKQKKHKPLKERWHAKGALPKDASGRTILPALLGNLTVVSLGEVVYDRPKYWSARYIYPVGFETTRSYFSPLVIDTKTVYHNKILDGGDAPLFEVSCTGKKRFIHHHHYIILLCFDNLEKK